VKLATRDTPEVLKKMISEQLARRSVEEERAAAEKGGLFSSIKRLLGGG
jgi:hypothetical protein